jgi:exodeoxyribonuclease V alpha subunit
MAAALEALPPEAGLLLVGDADQLPSIGAGQVLADLIAAGTALSGEVAWLPAFSAQRQ